MKLKLRRIIFLKKTSEDCFVPRKKPSSKTNFNCNYGHTRCPQVHWQRNTICAVYWCDIWYDDTFIRWTALSVAKVRHFVHGWNFQDSTKTVDTALPHQRSARPRPKYSAMCHFADIEIDRTICGNVQKTEGTGRWEEWSGSQSPCYHVWLWKWFDTCCAKWISKHFAQRVLFPLFSVSISTHKEFRTQAVIFLKSRIRSICPMVKIFLI